MRKSYLLFIALFAFTILGSSPKANAQAAYAGTYLMVGGYDSGIARGLYFTGIATAVSSGAVAYTTYMPYLGYPSYGKTTRATGSISAGGLFTSTVRGTTARLVILLFKYGLGTFSDGWGSGYLAFTKA